MSASQARHQSDADDDKPSPSLKKDDKKATAAGKRQPAKTAFEFEEQEKLQKQRVTELQQKQVSSSLQAES